MSDEQTRRLDRLLDLASRAAPLPLPARALIYGAGTVGRHVQCVLRAHGVRVDAFLDRRPRADVEGTPCLPPKSSQARRDSTVIVAAFNPGANPAEIVASLRSHGFERIITAPTFLADYGRAEGHFWTGPVKTYSDNAEAIRRALAIWSDEQSREYFVDRVDLAITGDPTLLASPRYEDQYMPPDIPQWREPIAFVDCGAYDGDTYLQLRKHKKQLSAVAAFEPDPENFARLRALLHAERLEHALALPFGLWSTTTELRFASGQGTISKLDPEGEHVVKCVALDEIELGFTPTLIKMDIEGAELEALAGARRLIFSERPDLALSIYHQAAHLWEIPLLVREWVPEHSFYVRPHAYNGIDFVMYATSPHRRSHRPASAASPR